MIKCNAGQGWQVQLLTGGKWHQYMMRHNPHSCQMFSECKVLIPMFKPPQCFRFAGCIAAFRQLLTDVGSLAWCQQAPGVQELMNPDDNSDEKSDADSALEEGMTLLVVILVDREVI